MKSSLNGLKRFKSFLRLSIIDVLLSLSLSVLLSLLVLPEEVELSPVLFPVVVFPPPEV